MQRQPLCFGEMLKSEKSIHFCAWSKRLLKQDLFVLFIQRHVPTPVRDPEEEYEREIDVLILGANKKGKEEADDLIHEAISVLRFMLPEKSDDE